MSPVGNTTFNFLQNLDKLVNSRLEYPKINILFNKLYKKSICILYIKYYTRRRNLFLHSTLNLPPQKGSKWFRGDDNLVELSSYKQNSRT